jgi:hypothetical protein
MKARVSTAVIVGFILAGMFKTFIYTPQVKADHCHPANNQSHLTTPAPPKTSNTPVTNNRHQHTNRRFLSINYNPAKSSVSSVKNGSERSGSLSIEEIYSKDFPLAISSIDRAVKAIQAGQKQTELAELNKALSKLTEIHKALGTHVKLQFANNFRCPIMGSPIKKDMVKESLIRLYNGRKVAFCCASCPAEWDKLSDADKQAKVPGLKS